MCKDMAGYESRWCACMGCMGCSSGWRPALCSPLPGRASAMPTGTDYLAALHAARVHAPTHEHLVGLIMATCNAALGSSKASHSSHHAPRLCAQPRPVIAHCDHVTFGLTKASGESCGGCCCARRGTGPALFHSTARLESHGRAVAAESKHMQATLTAASRLHSVGWHKPRWTAAAGSSQRFARRSCHSLW